MYKKYIKSIIDYSIALVAFFSLFPVFLIVFIGLYIANHGKPFFLQQRPGKNEKLFKIIKFKTMNDKKDSDGNLLPDAQRLTKIGNFVRKTSLDELPQLVNVLKGEMSIVGPRPERQYFIDQIIEKAPHYYNLQKVLPGITSWGQVKYGYAENINQMIKRLTFDIIYLENRSLALDFKIMFYTFITIIQGRGK